MALISAHAEKGQDSHDDHHQTDKIDNTVHWKTRIKYSATTNKRSPRPAVPDESA
jgi:hypothetical protein